jgi:hypothetical protein
LWIGRPITSPEETSPQNDLKGAADLIGIDVKRLHLSSFSHYTLPDLQAAVKAGFLATDGGINNFTTSKDFVLLSTNICPDFPRCHSVILSINWIDSTCWFGKLTLQSQTPNSGDNLELSYKQGAKAKVSNAHKPPPGNWS